MRDARDRRGARAADLPDDGNIGPASIPFTLAGIQDEIADGERVLCLGMGSGLNASVVEIIW